MISPPRLRERRLVVRDQAKNTSGLRLTATDGLSHLGSEQIDHHDPSRPNDVDVRRRMIVGVDHDPEPVDAQDRRHLLTLA